LAAPAATIEGRIIHPTRSEASAGLTVLLNGLLREGDTFQSSTVTGEGGHFSFRGLPPQGFYALGTTYDGVKFSGGTVVFEEGKPQTHSLMFHIYDRTSAPGGTRLERVRFAVAREGGRYLVQQQVVINNPELEVIVVDEKSPPLLLVGLASGHGEVRARLGPLPDGTRVRNGTAEIRGPVFPGERTYTFAYDLPDSGAALETELPVAEPLPELELVIRDFGIRVDAGTLHPARPVREGDSIYLRYVGFDLAADTRIPLRVLPLAPPTTPPPWLQGLLLLLVGGGLLLVVIRPIDQGVPVEAASGQTATDGEREAIIASLRDLEFDFETGKLSAEDRDRLREELRREAARTLARTREREKPPAPTACSCGRAPQPGDRFCAGCGAAL
jgi:hypothetical protein